MIGSNSRILALDVDEVIVDILTPWVERAYEDSRTAHIFKGMTKEQVVKAVSEYPAYAQVWMRKHLGATDADIAQFDLVYRGDSRFYEELKPTAFCISIHQAMKWSGAISHVHFVTHNFDNADPCSANKEKWLHHFFGEFTGRYTVHNVESSIKKADFLQRVCPEPNLFADDSLKNISEILLNDKVRPHEIAIPRMARTATIPDEMIKLAVLRRIKLSFYDPSPEGFDIDDALTQAPAAVRV